MKIYFVILLVLISISSLVFAENIYKCKDKNGDIQFSQVPCAPNEESATAKIGDNSSNVSWKDNSSTIELNNKTEGFLKISKFKIYLSEDKKIKVDYSLNLDTTRFLADNVFIVGVVTLVDWDNRVIDSFVIDKAVSKSDGLIQDLGLISNKSHRFTEIEQVIATFKQETRADYNSKKSEIIKELNSNIEKEVNDVQRSAQDRYSSSTSSAYSSAPYSSGGTGSVSVKSYYRKDGTYVSSHTRSHPKR